MEPDGTNLCTCLTWRRIGITIDNAFKQAIGIDNGLLLPHQNTVY